MQRSILVSLAATAGIVLLAPMGNAQDSFAVVPTARSDQLHLFAPVSVNGSQTKWFLVDTGAPLSLISPSAQKALSLPQAKTRDNVNVTVTNVGKKLPIVYAQSIKSGDMELGPGYLVAESIEFSHEKTRQARIPFDKEGLIGMNLLLKHGAVINCRTQQIFFSRQGSKLPLSSERYQKEWGYTYIPIRITPHGYVEVEGTIGSSRYSFVVDTGAFWTVLEPAIRNREHLSYYDTRIVTRLPYVTGQTGGFTMTKVPGFKIGEQDVSNLIVGFSETHFGDLGLSHEYGGLIGADLLFKCHAIIDLGNRALYLLPNTKR
jgi:predicted aspartyl protease